MRQLRFDSESCSIEITTPEVVFCCHRRDIRGISLTDTSVNITLPSNLAVLPHDTAADAAYTYLRVKAAVYTATNNFCYEFPLFQEGN